MLYNWELEFYASPTIVIFIIYSFNNKQSYISVVTQNKNLTLKECWGISESWKVRVQVFGRWKTIAMERLTIDYLWKAKESQLNWKDLLNVPLKQNYIHLLNNSEHIPNNGFPRTWNVHNAKSSQSLKELNFELFRNNGGIFWSKIDILNFNTSTFKTLQIRQRTNSPVSAVSEPESKAHVRITIVWEGLSTKNIGLGFI